MKTNYTLLIGLIVLVLTNCTNPKQTQDKAVPESAEKPTLYGNYVNDTYAIRHEGYDWVAVRVKEGADNSIYVSVRSRADKNNPTCSFDARAFKTDDNTYESVNEGKAIVYSFSNDSLTISTKNEADENMLYFFCSGGATFAGSYTKIDEPLDTNQVDKTSFIKVLRLQDVGFTVSSIRNNKANTFTVSTFGLPHDYNETFEITGSRVTDAEVEDLNADGSPELFVYTQSDGSGSYGNVYAFSVNNLKSMSQVNFPPVAENTELNKGYMGHDAFAVVENRLVQRFPVYNDGDSNANSTGGTRQISYKLTEGEAMRQLKVDRVSEYWISYWVNKLLSEWVNELLSELVIEWMRKSFVLPGNCFPIFST